MPDVADYITETLVQLGVEYVFGIPGGAIEPMFNALGRARNKITLVTSMHECAAGYMAQGYYLKTGKLGVCCVTTGPGVTNLVTSIASANEDNVPLLIISPQIPLPYFERGGLQESFNRTNTIDLLKSITTYSNIVMHPKQIFFILRSAILRALTERKPVHISIPSDVLTTKLTYDTISIQEYILPKYCVDNEYIFRLKDLLLDAEKIAILVGRDCVEAAESIEEFANFIGAYIISTPPGKLCVNAQNPNYCGVFGLAGHESAIELLKDPTIDVLLSIGTNHDVFSTNNWSEHLLHHKALVNICEHIEIESIIRTSKAKLQLQGNIKQIVQALHDALILHKQNLDDGENRVPLIPRTVNEYPLTYMDNNHLYDSNPIKPQRLFYLLSQLFPTGTVFLSDIGNSFVWGSHYVQTPLHCYYSSYTFAPMTWAIGTSIGMALASPNEVYVAFVGDGAFLMDGFEISVAQKYKLKIVFVILNDSAYGMVAHGQKLNNAERLGWELPTVRFNTIAECLGLKAYEINSAEDLKALNIYSAEDLDGPVLLDVNIDKQAVPPMGVRLINLNQKN
ncbi:Acetolactate synthase [Legionella nautarum]|uniref:Acetolactate synthase n=1 Tax=Legionella nautarum TaxID=45070 RepID=A0A0W0WKH7_9GAMM|nr:thiamine pyrophosphate-binding protein [Legionella nautarum]KTD32825.1 Acetolactate synthase [Legionella nautarum]